MEIYQEAPRSVKSCICMDLVCDIKPTKPDDIKVTAGMSWVSGNDASQGYHLIKAVTLLLLSLQKQLYEFIINYNLQIFF